MGNLGALRWVLLVLGTIALLASLVTARRRALSAVLMVCATACYGAVAYSYGR